MDEKNNPDADGSQGCLLKICALIVANRRFSG
jgi:hypothetical protein